MRWMLQGRRFRERGLGGEGLSWSWVEPSKHFHKPNRGDSLPTPQGYLGQKEVKPGLGPHWFRGRGTVTRVVVFGLF